MGSESIVNHCEFGIYLTRVTGKEIYSNTACSCLPQYRMLQKEEQCSNTGPDAGAYYLEQPSAPPPPQDKGSFVSYHCRSKIEFRVLHGWGSWTVRISISEDLLGIQSLRLHASLAKADFGEIEHRKHSLQMIRTRIWGAKRT